MSQEYPRVLANIESHKKFIELYPKFCDALPGIVDLTNRVTTQPNTEDADQDRKLANVLMVQLAILTFEDFDEVVLLCADGHSRGGLKILRGMFERSVTLREIDEHPDRAKSFYEYFYVDRFKLAMQIKEACPDLLPKEKLEEISRARDEVKGNYMQPCEKCGHLTTSGSWMKAGIVEAAKRLGFGGTMLIHAYYEALEETHPKLGAIYHRRGFADQVLQFDTTVDSLSTAHILLLENVRAMIERFGMAELDHLHQKCVQEYRDAWPTRPDE